MKVGSAAQSTYAAGFLVEPVKNMKIDASYRYVDRLYANLNVASFNTEAAGNAGALKLPSFGLFDLGASYKFFINAKQSFTIRGNVYNVFDKVYISESNTNIFADLSKDEFGALNPNLTGTTLTTKYLSLIHI